jgi:hypothetical protein
VIALVAPLVVSACNRSATSAPTTPSPRLADASSATTMPFHLSGIATDGDYQPVPAVRVDVYPWVGGSALYGSIVSTLTDASGAYVVDFNAVRSASGAVAGLLTDKAGYEPDDRGFIRPSGSTAVQSLRIYRIRRLVPGESTHIVVAPDDPHCGIDDEWVCRTVRVTSSSSGTIMIETVADNGAAPLSGLEVWRPSYSCCAPHQTISVSAGVEVIAHVLMVWTATASEGYTVSTSFAP